MSSTADKRREGRIRRHRRVRRKVIGTAERPRLCVFRSAKHIYATLVNDSESRCLLTVSSLSADVKAALGDAGDKTSVSTAVGKVLAGKAKAVGIETVSFDRGGYLYHGRVKALAEAAREGGLSF
jgi:large subunit ribosomal protein L18